MGSVGVASNTTGSNLSRTHFYPTADNSFDLGGPDSNQTNNGTTFGATRRWKDIYAGNGTIKTSDLRMKKNIEVYPNNYEILFNTLKPIRYQFIDGSSDRYHCGFISQQIEESLQKAGLSSFDFAGFIKTPTGNDFAYGLRYDEFISLNTWQIQKLKPRVSALEQTILDYESRISALETEIQNLKSV